MTKNRVSLRHLAFWTGFVLLHFSVVYAQSQLASLTGRVTDPSAAVLPNLSVQLTNTETGERFSATTNSAGVYLFPVVKPGKYDLQVEGTGFKRYQRIGIVLETGNQTRLDFEMEVGATEDSVTVVGSAPLLQSETAAVTNIVENRTIADMPLINRRALQLVKLSGFVVPIGNDQGRAAMAGGRGAENFVSVDGGLIQNVSTDTPEPFFDPPIESLQEFNVSISNFAAELGRTGGGVIQMTTKSGTNSFHGAAYEFLRNDKFDARTFFAAGKEKLRYNLFGAAIGGPIRRNRTFFFFNYEGLRNNSETTRILNVPTLAETRGDFSGSRTVVRDPLTGEPFPGNIIPADRLDPVGLKLAALYPEPNVPGRPSRSSNFRGVQPVSQPSNTYVGRLDHAFRDQDRVYGRILASTSRNDRGPVFPIPGVDSFNQIVVTTYQNLSGTWFHNFNPTLLNEFRVTWVRRTAPQWHGGLDSGMVDQIGLTGTDPELFPRVNVEGLTPLGNPNRQFRSQSPIRSNDFIDHMTKIHGAHTFKFGFEYRMDFNVDDFRGTGGGSFSFSSRATNDALAALLLGRVDTATRQQSLPIKSRADYMAAFIQDDWKVASNFTLNLGLRWDYDQPRWEAFDNRQNSFDRAAVNPVSGTPGVVTFSGRNGLSKYAHEKDLNNFGPRLGFAWRIGNSWVVRGGAAVTYLAAYNNNVAFDPSMGFGILGSFVSPDSGVTPAFLLRNGMPILSVPTESDLTPAFGAVKVGQSPSTSVLFLDTNRRNGYLEQFNFSIQRLLTSNILLEVGYVGRLGHKLPAPSNQTINQVPPELMGPGNAQLRRPFPQFSDVQVMLPAIGNSNYHGMNVRVEKRLSYGLHFQSNYTWSRFIDDTEARAELGGAPGTGFADFYNRRADRGLSGSNISHRFIWSSVYDLPVGKGRAWQISNRFLNGVVGGWSLGYILEMRTGPPYGVIEQTNRTNSFSDSVRPNVVGIAEISGSRSRDEQINRWFNTDAFAAPAPFTFGNAGKTSGNGPGAVTMDLSILKDFSILESHTLQFRAEMLNLANRPNFGLPATARGAANFGQIRSLAPGNQSRTIQFGLRYSF
ncbi:MAG: TonB-dependent receptor [Acidobacteriales bacterium]|nr:TonB-dependent receptor [Terriglobales bacterium]